MNQVGEALYPGADVSPLVVMPLVKKSVKIREDQDEKIDEDESFNFSGAVREMLDERYGLEGDDEA